MRIKLNSKNFIELTLVDNVQRDLVLILPGGGYTVTSPRESKPVAQVFQNAGFHTAIYYYRETLLMYPLVKEEGYEALKSLQKNKMVKRIFLIGFSAGGHLAAMLMTSYYQLVHGTILAYPVISTHPLYKYKDLENRLLGNQQTPDKIKEISIEHQVHKHVRPVFIMHTLDDATVPVENSLFLIDALKKNDVLVESHLYPTGRHGVSIATQEVTFSDMDPMVYVEKYSYLSNWINLAIQFLERIYK